MRITATSGESSYVLRPIKPSDLAWLAEALSDYPAGFIGIAQAQHELDYMVYHSLRFDRTKLMSDAPENEQAIALVLEDDGAPKCMRFTSFRSGVAWHRMECTHPSARRQGDATAQALILGDVWFDKLGLLEIRAETIKEDAASTKFASSFRDAPAVGDDDYTRPSRRDSRLNIKGFRITAAEFRSIAKRKSNPPWTVSVEW